jgi:imidazoleglycerol-phosphate dehydratase
MPRSAEIQRQTAETRIALSLEIDGSGQSAVNTRIPFLDHMLTLFAKHSLTNLKVDTAGDIEVDFHHTVEDTGIALGQAFSKALGDRKGIARYGHAYVPMDETLARAVIDFSGRPFIDFRSPAPLAQTHFPYTLLEEFLRAFANSAAANVHVEVLHGRDAHHMMEAVFKGLARAIEMACRIDPRVSGVPSTKGTLTA